MKDPLVFLLLLLATSAAASIIGSTTGSCSLRRLLVVSYDAFSSDYFARDITPNAKAFQDEGLLVKRLRSVFPTKTMTNHFTIVTGLYPEVHGVSANSLYDEDYGELSYSRELFGYNRNITPIFTLNELAGKHSGCMMWPGSDYTYQNVNCTYFAKYDKNLPLRSRVDTLMKWLTDEKKPANFVLMYAERPDNIGHRVGINAKEINDNIKEVDDVTGYIQEQLKLNNLISCTDVIHLSDHGMIEVDISRILDISKFLVPGSYKTYGTSPVLQIVPQNKNETTEIYNKLVTASEVLGNFKVYMQPDLPERWHVKTPRLGPIVLVADLNYVFQDLYDNIGYYREKYNQTELGRYGVHGYDNEYPEMAGYLMAKGPSFPSGEVLNGYENIDLYNLFVKILQLPNAPPTNGSDFQSERILSKSKGSNIVSIFVAAILLIVVIACLIVYVIYQRNQYGCLGF